MKFGGAMADEVTVARGLAAIAIVACLPVAWCAPWVRVATSHFEIYTTAEEDSGRSLISRLERLRATLQPVLGLPEASVCVIEFGTRDEFQTYAPMSRSIGFFLPGTRRDFVVLDGTHAEGRAAAHEFVHFAMKQSGLRLPTWLNEGLAELYSNIEDGRIGGFIPSRVNSLSRDQWIGLSELTAARSDSEIFTGSRSVDSAYAESWLFAHMLVLDPRYGSKFPDLLKALQSSDTDAAFRRIYEMSLEQVEIDLKAYVGMGWRNSRAVAEESATEASDITIDREAGFDGLSAVAEMLGNYRGRTEQSRELYRQLERDYPQRLP